ncbi:MAG: class I adenylate-forming enzyme family protein [Candidatus Jordarchaeum sp.]|uniref:class I adenylate-forming enzyme family protein n=1 Tax=Candidatus Jordarchaeum sp. TaxID=2823881 RepID=UPI004049D9CE
MGAPWDCKLIGEFLEFDAAEYPDKEAVVHKDQRMTFEELNETVDRLAKSFLKLGIKKGEKIITIIPPRPEWLYVALAAAKIGAVTVSLDWRDELKDFEYQIPLVKPTTIINMNQFLSRMYSRILDQIRDQFTTVKNYISIAGTYLPGSIAFEDLVSKPRDEMNRELEERKSEVQEDDPVLCMYTTGTTGPPKPVILTHKNICKCVEYLAKYIGANPEDVAIGNMPVSHAAGSVHAEMQSIILGNKLVMLEKYDTEDTLKLVQREKVTFVGWPPTVYIMILNLRNFDQYDMSSIRMAVAGAGYTSPELAQRIIDNISPSFYNCWGMTELSGVATIARPEDGIEKTKCTLGKPTSSEIKIKLVDEEGKVVSRGEVGEIMVKGPTVFKEYYLMPEKNAESFDEENYFHTGDRAKQDEDGFYVFVDRIKEMYKSGGYNVSPLEIEEFLMAHPDILLAGVIAVPDEKWGEVGRAYYQKVPGSKITDKDVEEYCRRGLAAYKVPKEFKWRNLPIIGAGKVSKKKLREELEKELEKEEKLKRLREERMKESQDS